MMISHNAPEWKGGQEKTAREQTVRTEYDVVLVRVQAPPRQASRVSSDPAGSVGGTGEDSFIWSSQAACSVF